MVNKDDFLQLTPRQEDIYNTMLEEHLMVDGKPVTRQRVKESYPSTEIQPRKKKKTTPKATRKKKGCGCK